MVAPSLFRRNGDRRRLDRVEDPRDALRHAVLLAAAFLRIVAGRGAVRRRVARRAPVGDLRQQVQRRARGRPLRGAHPRQDLAVQPLPADDEQAPGELFVQPVELRRRARRRRVVEPRLALRPFRGQRVDLEMVLGAAIAVGARVPQAHREEAARLLLAPSRLPLRRRAALHEVEDHPLHRLVRGVRIAREPRDKPPQFGEQNSSRLVLER